MAGINMDDYSELDGFGFARQAPVDPEKEFFHSIYIAGQSRQNHIGVVEEAGKFQIRGVMYNQEKVNMVITHVKTVLVKEVNDQGREKVICFSFADGPKPWKGTSGNICGEKSAERAAHPYCSTCRSQLIVAGILVDSSGRPIFPKDEQKPIFVFIRGKGVKYGPIADYLSEMVSKDLPPIVSPVTEESKKWEKQNVNYRRFVTEIIKGNVQTRHGNKTTFVLKSGSQLPDGFVGEILKVAKKSSDKFNSKFDWSKRTSGQQSQPTGYSMEVKPETEQTFTTTSEPPVGTVTQDESKGKSKKDQPFISFDDVEF